MSIKKLFIFYFSQTSDQTCATLVVDEEPDDTVVLNQDCNAFKTPESKCSFGKKYFNNVQGMF